MFLISDVHFLRKINSDYLINIKIYKLKFQTPYFENCLAHILFNPVAMCRYPVAVGSRLTVLELPTLFHPSRNSVSVPDLISAFYNAATRHPWQLRQRVLQESPSPPHGARILLHVRDDWFRFAFWGLVLNADVYTDVYNWEHTIMVVMFVVEQTKGR